MDWLEEIKNKNGLITQNDVGKMALALKYAFNVIKITEHDLGRRVANPAVIKNSLDEAIQKLYKGRF
jgi:hypothetical protein